MTAAHSAREEVSALPGRARRDNPPVMDRLETIAILGAGTMARAVGRAARRAGYEIVFGARRIDAAREAARRTGPGALKPPHARNERPSWPAASRDGFREACNLQSGQP